MKKQQSTLQQLAEQGMRSAQQGLTFPEELSEIGLVISGRGGKEGEHPKNYSLGPPCIWHIRGVAPKFSGVTAKPPRSS